MSKIEDMSEPDCGPRYIAVEGPIGVGKTSLARRLAESFDAELIEEDAMENPFLERFYRDPKRGALPAQLFFLFSRARKIDDMSQEDLFDTVRVSDFLMYKDRLFAELTLDAEEFQLYEQVWRQLGIHPPKPDLVVYLQAPADRLLTRVASRGIAFEQMIGREYLEKLMEAYARFFHTYDDSPLLIVNAADIDPVSNDEDYFQLLDVIRQTKSGRHYFNPAMRGIA